MRRLEGRSNHLYDRDGKFVFRRAVPVELQKELGRREWKRTLGCMSYMKPWEAERKAELFKKQTDSEIKIARRTVHRMEGDDEQGQLGYESALELDVLLRAANEVGGIENLQNQFGDQSAVFRRFGTAKERQTLLGEKPLSFVLKYVKQQHPVESEKHRDLVVKHFIELMGDRDVMTIIRRDVLDFIKLYKKKGYAAGTLRRRLGALTSIVNHFFRDHDIHLNNPFAGCVHEAGPGPSIEDRLPLTNEQVRTVTNSLKTAPQISDFNKAVLWLIATTGLGPAEAGGLVAEDIVLGHEIPHIWIRGNSARRIKNRSRIRRLPLVGDALVYAPFLLGRKCAVKSVGAPLNKYLNKTLDLDERQSLYSFRHWMADRLRVVGASDTQAKYILGHFGDGSSHSNYGSKHLELDAIRSLIISATNVFQFEGSELQAI